jgi:peptidoglycan/xylan/chitin deacetylase (PgdA/CDA1 family)
VDRGDTIRWRTIAADRGDELVARGRRRRSFFPHRAVFLPRPGPDGCKLAARMCGRSDPSSLWEVVLFADEATLAEFPRDLFFDDELIWHRQHFGRPGHVACANVVIDGDEMWSMSHFSDLVQRIGLRREHKTRIEKRFGGWHDMLLNALLALAAERGVRRLRVPTSTLQMKHTDPARNVRPELFERIYDRGVNRLFDAVRADGWWLVDVAANRERLAVPTLHEERLERGRTICVCHDVEAGLGHRGVDERLARLADETWRESVAGMLGHERATGVRATYNVVGRLLDDVRPELEADAHCIGFHSYDHALEPRRLPAAVRTLLRSRQGERVAGLAGSLDQLAACRRIDYRIKGYRPPQSRITPGLADANLLFHNFEWLASSVPSLARSEPALHDGIVRIPVHIDDFALYRDRVGFDVWKAKALETAARHDVSVISLHDCYAHLWLDGYPELLEELTALGDVRTLDEIAADVVLSAAA